MLQFTVSRSHLLLYSERK